MQRKQDMGAQAIMGNPSKKGFKGMASNNMVPNCLIASTSLMHAPTLAQISQAFEGKQSGVHQNQWWQIKLLFHRGLQNKTKV